MFIIVMEQVNIMVEINMIISMMEMMALLKESKINLNITRLIINLLICDLSY